MPDHELTREQAYLAGAREHLARMRRRTLALQVQAGDRVSGEYLAATLWRRAQSLVDDPDTALFFGRTDHGDGSRWYIGRRHVADEQGDPAVIDWRADVARGFYRASRSQPLGVQRRRRFGIESGRITAYEDEHLTDPTADAEAGRRSAILTREIERPRVGPMRDIVATIQPEQDELVRADLATSLCVQGAPGTGKTAVGLHRAAWLLYAFRERLARAGVLVVGPTSSFLDHVAAVLPSLGEMDVRHTTVEDLVASTPGARVVVRGRDDVAVAALKADARMAEVLRRAVWGHARMPEAALVLPRGVRRWRLSAAEAGSIVAELSARGVRYSAARSMLAQRLSHALLVQMEAAGESPDDRVQDAVARSREVRLYVAEVWPALTPTRVLHRLLSDAALLAVCCDGVLEPDEQALLLRTGPVRSPGSTRWSAADAVLLDELADLLERTASLGHVVLDEAQDLSAMQLRAVGRRCATGSLTVLGDLAQGTTPWATPSWEQSLAHLGKPDAALEVLDRGFRVPSAVIDWAAKLLPTIAPGLSIPVSVRDDPGSLQVVLVTAGRGADQRVIEAAIVAVQDALEHEGSVGVIVPDAWVGRSHAGLDTAGVAHVVLGTATSARARATTATARASHVAPSRVWLVPATLAKGLEYDLVVVVEPAAITEAEPDERTGLRRLYVVLTRAVSGLAVVHGRPLPRALAGRDPAPPDPFA